MANHNAIPSPPTAKTAPTTTSQCHGRLGPSEDQLSDDFSVEEWTLPTFSLSRRIHIVVAGFTCTFNGNLGSSMPSGALDAISAHFGVEQRVLLILLNSLYMVGFCLGPLLWGPLSEYIGRRPVMVGTYLGYLVFMLACSAAPNYAALLVFRLLGGINAAAPTTVIGGLYADVIEDPSVRGMYLAVYMAITSIGPLVGPLISGFSSTVSWRWPFWIAGLVATAGLPLVVTLPETYAPVLRRKAAETRSQLESEEKGDLVPPNPFDARKIFLRPLYFLVTEPIVLATSLYLALSYSVFYLMFQAFPLVFQGFYGLSPGTAGLAYIPSMVGAVLALAIFAAYSLYHDRQSAAGAAWTKKTVYRRLPLACIASPLMVIGLFWLGWTVSPSPSPVLASFSGLFFVCGFQLVFMGMINYLTDAFKEESASVLAAASTTRSIGAVLLPLVTDAMYNKLGLHWAPSLVALLALAMGVIPFIFIHMGDRLKRKEESAPLRDSLHSGRMGVMRRNKRRGSSSYNGNTA